MNKVLLMGRISKDLELKQTSGNKNYLNFTIAVNKRFKKEGEPTADFINCVAWEKTAEIINQYHKKGDQIIVIGRIQTRNYKDKDDKIVYITEIAVDEIDFISNGKKNDGKIINNNEPVGFPPVNEIDELPF